MAVSRTFVAKSVAFGAATWDKDSVGPLSVTVAHSGTPVISRTGADLYPHRISVQDRTCVCTVVVGEFKYTTALSTDGALVIVARYEEGGQDITLTLATMKLYEVRSTQNRANPSETALTFIHVSADGTTNPLS